MKKLLCLSVTALLLSAGGAMAEEESATAFKGPPGCKWSATIQNVNDAAMTVKLDEKLGSCELTPTNCGEVGNSVVVDRSPGVDKPMPDHTAGHKVDIWVSSDMAAPHNLMGTAALPKCE